MKDANGDWIGYGVGDKGVEVAAINQKLHDKYQWARTAGVAPGDTYTGTTAWAIGEFCRRVGLPIVFDPNGDPVANLAIRTRLGAYVVPAPPPPKRGPLTWFTVAGTWADMWSGFPADVANGLDKRYWYWQPVNYPASFGPIGGGPAPSYEESVAVGVEELIRLIEITPGRFALCGYSQGAEVVARVLIELISGRLTDRLKDCLWYVAFGDPARQSGVCVGRDPGGSGISGIRFTVPASVKMLVYALDGDMYCTTPDKTEGGTNMRAVYKALTKMQIHDPGRDIISALTGDPSIMRQLMRLFSDPVSGGIGLIDALFRLAKFAVTNAHVRYGELEVLPGLTAVQHAINTLNADAARIILAA